MGATLQIQPSRADPFEVLIGNTATIGRTRENTVCLNFSPLVSRQHAVIRCHNGYQYQIIDLGSRNGTYVNDRRVILPAPLENGARIRIDAGKRMLKLAEERTWPAGEPFRIAVALHHGRVMCSNVGLSAERDATIIGDAVNTIFRLEAVGKELSQRLVLSGSFCDHLGAREELHDFGERRLKGKSTRVRVLGLP